MPAKTNASPDYAAMDADGGFTSGYSKKVAERAAAAAFLKKWHVDNCTPFSDCDEILRQLHGLTTVLSNACKDADTLKRENPGVSDASAVDSIYPVFMARAFDAIGTLTALTIFFGESA